MNGGWEKAKKTIYLGRELKHTIAKVGIECYVYYLIQFLVIE